MLYDVASSTPIDDAIVYSPRTNYVDGDLSVVRQMINSPRALFSLSDSGAHCTSICDASFPTWALSYWTRDTDLAPLSVEYVVHCQTARLAGYLGWKDRGVVAPGYLADLNIIDLSALVARRPHLVHDLPAGGSRYLQAADGYRATIKRGEVVAEDGELTERRPGQLVRGAQPVPS